MSMLEAPHENDIRLEGHLLLLKSFVHFVFSSNIVYAYIQLGLHSPP